jgi:hypothetical protein
MLSNINCNRSLEFRRLCIGEKYLWKDAEKDSYTCSKLAPVFALSYHQRGSFLLEMFELDGKEFLCFRFDHKYNTTPTSTETSFVDRYGKTNYLSAEAKDMMLRTIFVLSKKAFAGQGIVLSWIDSSTSCQPLPSLSLSDSGLYPIKGSPSEAPKPKRFHRSVSFSADSILSSVSSARDTSSLYQPRVISVLSRSVQEGIASLTLDKLVGDENYTLIVAIVKSERLLEIVKQSFYMICERNYPTSTLYKACEDSVASHWVDYYELYVLLMKQQQKTGLVRFRKTEVVLSLPPFSRAMLVHWIKELSFQKLGTRKEIEDILRHLSAEDIQKITLGELRALVSKLKTRKHEFRVSKRAASDVNVHASLSKDILDSEKKLAQLKTALAAVFKMRYRIDFVYEVSVKYHEIFSCSDWFHYYDLYWFHYYDVNWFSKKEEEAVAVSVLSEKGVSVDFGDNHNDIESSVNATDSPHFMKSSFLFSSSLSPESSNSRSFGKENFESI